MKLRHFAIFLAATSLTGCGMSALRATKPNTVIGAVGPTGVGYGIGRTGSLVRALERDYLISYCLDGGTVGVSRSGNTISLGKNELCASLYTDDFKTLQPFVIGLDSRKAAERLTESGFRLTKTVCLAYFNRIGNQGQDSDFYKKFINAFGGVVSATLGLTGSPSKSVALTATGFSGFLAGLESFDEVYHFTPDRQYVIDLIMRSMNTYEQEVVSKKRNQTFNQAVDSILAYQSMCQTDFIRKTVNDAITSAKVRPYSSPNIDRFTSNRLSAQQRVDLARSLNATSLNDAQIVLLIKASRGELGGPEELESAYELLKNTGPQLVTFNIAAGDATYAIDREVLDNTNKIIDEFRTTLPDIYARYLDEVLNPGESFISLRDVEESSASGPVDLPVVID